MSDIRRQLELCREAFGPNVYNDFMLSHGCEYTMGRETFRGKRGIPKNCFGNATHLAINDRTLTYVEGKVTVHGVPIDHAWCATPSGVVIDPTIVDKGQIGCYFGVPFLTDYVRRAVLLNNCYGLLDYFHARKTAPKLFELGLTVGQLWLINQPPKPKRRRNAGRKNNSNESSSQNL